MLYFVGGNVSSAILIHTDIGISFPENRKDKENENFIDLEEGGFHITKSFMFCFVVFCCVCFFSSEKGKNDRCLYSLPGNLNFGSPGD